MLILKIHILLELLLAYKTLKIKNHLCQKNPFAKLSTLSIFCTAHCIPYQKFKI